MKYDRLILDDSKEAMLSKAALEAEAWVQFAAAALPNEFDPEEAALAADKMMKEFRKRFMPLEE